MMGIECRCSIKMTVLGVYNAKKDDVSNVGSDQNIYSDKLGYCDEKESARNQIKNLSKSIETGQRSLGINDLKAQRQRKP